MPYAVVALLALCVTGCGLVLDYDTSFSIGRKEPRTKDDYVGERWSFIMFGVGQGDFTVRGPYPTKTVCLHERILLGSRYKRAAIGECFSGQHVVVD